MSDNTNTIREPMPEGDYEAIAVSAELGMTKTGKEQVCIACRVTSGPHEGRVVPYYGTFTPNAMQYTIGALRAAGWKGNDVSDLSSVKDTPVSIKVEIDTYDPTRPRNKVAFINSRGVFIRDKLEGTQRQSFAERMKGAIMALEAGQGAARVAGPVMPTMPADDDIPF